MTEQELADANPQIVDNAAGYEEDEGEAAAAAMAAMMGFSAFGTQGSSKKRKYNPNTDAAIDGQALEKVDRGGKRGKGSGGNQIPLGKTRAFGTTNGANAELQHEEIIGRNLEEIILDDEDEDEDGGKYNEFGNVSYRGGAGGGNEVEGLRKGSTQVRGQNRSQGKIISKQPNGDIEPTPFEILIRPTPSLAQAERDLVQERIDAITTKTTYTPSIQIDPDSYNRDSPLKGLDQATRTIYTPSPIVELDPDSYERLPPSPVPKRPNQATTFNNDDLRQRTENPGTGEDQSYNGGHINASNQNTDSYGRNDYGLPTRIHKAALARGSSIWYVGYFDLAFIRNPWEKLEKERGLKPRGTWPNDVGSKRNNWRDRGLEGEDWTRTDVEKEEGEGVEGG